MAKRGKTYLSPSSWGQLANNYFNMYRGSLQWYEMMTASAVTIGLRLTSVNEDLKRNRLPDQTELQRMITEKNKAMTKSAFALADWQSSLVRNRTLNRKSNWSPENPATMFTSGFSVWSNLLAHNIELGSVLLKGYSEMLKPFHSASTANAFRLSGVRRKPR